MAQPAESAQEPDLARGQPLAGTLPSAATAHYGKEGWYALPVGTELLPTSGELPPDAEASNGACEREVDLKSPVQEYCPPGSVRGARGNPCPYLDRFRATGKHSLRRVLQGALRAWDGSPSWWGEGRERECGSKVKKKSKRFYTHLKCNPKSPFSPPSDFGPRPVVYGL
jgi:hypothetical protein